MDRQAVDSQTSDEQRGGLGMRASNSTILPFKVAKRHLVEAFERRYLARLLVACGGHQGAAARRAGISRRHLRDLLKKYGLGRDDLDAVDDDAQTVAA